MGYETVELRARASVSRHHDERQEEDDRRWEEFTARVRELAKGYGDLGAFGIEVDG